MVALEIFGLKIHWYGLFYGIAFIVGYLFLLLLKNINYFKNYNNLNKLINQGIDDIFLYISLGVIMGGRLGHVIFYNLNYYINNPIEIFYIWNGGMGFVGGVIGVVISIFLLKRKYNLNKDEFLIMIDTIVAIMPFGIMLGRIGNYLNQELYGKTLNELITYQDLKKLIERSILTTKYEKIDNEIRLNTNFIESFFEGFIILIINQIIFWKSKIKPGLISGIFLVFYGVVRFIIEYLRDYESNEFIGFLTKTQYFMIAFVIIGIFLIIKSFHYNKS